MSQYYCQAQPFTLFGAGASLGDTSVTLSSFNGIDGTALAMGDFGTKGFLTLEPGSSSQEEQISFTGITTNSNGTVTLTGVKTVLFVNPYTETSGLAKSHAGATRVVISNTAGFYGGIATKSNDETITGTWTYTSTAIPSYNAHPTFSSNTQLIDKKYADDLAIAGAPNASTVVQGLVQLPTQAQVDARTALGSTGAALVVTPATNRTVLMHDYVASASGTDAYAITITPAITAYTAGDVFWFKADVANTGAATLSVSGLATKTITNKNGATLLDKDITAGSFNCVMYDGTNMVLLASSGSMPLSQSGREIYAATATGNDTYVVTLSPVPLAYYPGFTVRFKVDVGNTAGATLNVNSLGATALVRPSGVALSTGDITAGNVITAVYDGTNFQVSGLVPAALTAGATSNADTLHTHSSYDVALQDINANVKVFMGGMNDGLTFDGGAGGSGARTPFLTYLDAAGGGGGEGSLISPVLFTGLNWDNLPAMKFFASVEESNTTNDISFGFFNSGLASAFVNATSTTRHVAFLTDGAVLYASVGDGTTQNRTNVTGATTLTDFNLYQIEMTGSSAIFTINSVVVATLSTNYPTTAGTGIFLSFCTEAADTDLRIKHPFAVKLTNLLTT